MEIGNLAWYSVLLIMTNVVVFWISCFGEERAIYLVLMEDEPVAFHGGGSRIHEDGRRVNPNSEISKAHAKKLMDSHDKLLQSNLEMGTYTKLYSFNHIINGFAVHTSPSQAKKLKDAPKVKMVERDRGVRLMTTYTPQFLGLPKGVWRKEGKDISYVGEGIVIGFVDSGINPTHPSFGYDPPNPNNPKFNLNISDHFFGECEEGPLFPLSSCNGKIVSARFFSAGAQAIAVLNTSIDFLSPFDADGHGSHVASIAAGNAGVSVVINGFFYGLASGMAPRAQIAVYKAVYPTVGTLTDVISAIDQAAADGVDILTLSVGPDEPPEEDSYTFLNIYDIAMLFARRAGIFVAQAVGNHGPSPSTTLSFSPWATGVAASSTDRIYHSSLLLGNGLSLSGLGLSPPTFGHGVFMFKLVLAKDGVRANGSFPVGSLEYEECQFPEAFDIHVVQGSIVICMFSGGFLNGTSTVSAIVETAKTLGFMGFIFVANPMYGDFIAEPIPFTVSGIIITKVADTQVILKYYEEQTCRNNKGAATKFKAKAGIGEGRVASFGSRAPTVSRFSSRGPDFKDINRNPADVLKPDILAPGHQIWAAWSPISASQPLFKGNNFALISGTSMATPHIVGIAALIRQKHPFWNPSMIASAMSTTATRYDQSNGEVLMAEGFDIGSLYPSTPFDLGAGLICPAQAIDPGLVFSSDYEDYINFLCSIHGIEPATIKATTGETCNNNSSLSHPANLNLPSITISSLIGSQKLKRSVINVGEKLETYICSAIPPNGTNVALFPPWFTISPQETQDLIIDINVTMKMDDFSFGEIVLTGSLNHIVRLPVSVFAVSTS